MRDPTWEYLEYLRYVSFMGELYRIRKYCLQTNNPISINDIFNMRGEFSLPHVTYPLPPTFMEIK